MEIKNQKFFTEIKYQIEKLQNGYDKETANQKIAEYMYGMIQDYEDVNNDKKRLVREIDVILFGKGAAQQASLCDLVNPIRDFKTRYDKIKDALKHIVDMSGKWGREWFTKEDWYKIENAKNVIKETQN